MKKILLPIILSIILYSNISYSQPAWQWINPKPNGQDYADIQFAGTNVVYILNLTGNLIKSTDGGNNWINISNYFYQEFFKTMYFLNENTGYIGGREVYKTVNGGVNWVKQNIDSFYFCNDIQFVNSLTGYMASQYGRCLIKTTDGGVNWFTISYISFNKLQFLNANTGFLTTFSQIYKTTNGGLNFTVLYEGQDISDFYFLDNLTGVVADDLFITLDSIITVVRKTEDGKNFNTILGMPDEYINSIKMLDEDRIILCGQRGDSVFREHIYLSTNGGNSFNKIPLQYSYGERIIDFKDVNTGITLGFNGNFHKTTNGGFNWTLLTNGIIQRFYDLEFVDYNTGFISADSGKIFRTTDNGLNWNLFSNLNNQLENRNIKFFDANTGYMLSKNKTSDLSILSKSSNGGLNWTASSNIPYDLSDLYFLNQNTGFAFGTTYPFPLTVTNLLKTTNGGVNWDLKNTGDYTLTNCYFFNENLGFAGTLNSTILRTTNGGNNWQAINVPNAERIYDFKFYNENTGFLSAHANIIADGFARVFKTTNSGLNWTLYKNYIAPYSSAYESNILLIDSLRIWGTFFSGFFRSKMNSDTLSFENAGGTFSAEDFVFLNDSTGIMIHAYDGILRTTNGGVSSIRKISNENIVIKDFSLYQNYPNPFNPETKIKFNIPKTGFVKLSVYDITGREIQTLVNQNLSQGIYEVNFNGSNLSSGIYFYTLKTQSYIETRKMMLIK